jgi:hypothetical protein
VRPTGKSNDTMPLEVAFKTMNPLDRNPVDNVFHIKVFSVPPYPYRKKNPHDPYSTELTI